MKIERILEILNKTAPESLQEKWDNSGIQILEEQEKDVKHIITCIEINDDVIDEAVSKAADMIITHHPLIFSGIHQVDIKSITGNRIIRLIRNGISVYSSHTSFDSAEHGTNQDLAEQLDLTDIVPMVPAELPGCGMGRFGVYREPKSFDDFMERLREVCPDGDIRIAGKQPGLVGKVALCTGSGSEFIEDAYKEGADVFITGDLKYHDARHADDIGFCVIDAGHYGTEILFARNMAGLLTDALGSDVKISVSETDVNPFR